MGLMLGRINQGEFLPRFPCGRERLAPCYRALNAGFSAFRPNNFILSTARGFLPGFVCFSQNKTSGSCRKPQFSNETQGKCEYS